MQQKLQRLPGFTTRINRAIVIQHLDPRGVGIARALMQKPDLLMADEPVSALDPATSHSIMQYLELMNKEDGVTVIASLHFLSLARRYGTRILALKDGAIVYGEPVGAEEAKAARELVKSCEVDFTLLDNEVNRILWVFTNLFEGCLLKSIMGIRQKKKSSTSYAPPAPGEGGGKSGQS